MPFEKGNPGKPKGSVNQTTAKARKIIMDAIDGQSVHFSETMDQIREDSPRTWASIMVKLMDFVLPKKLDVTSGDEALGRVDLSGLSYEQLQKLANDNPGTDKASG